jgi:putative alpha-1,2-mannosidase
VRRINDGRSLDCSEHCNEGNLDLQYIMGVAQNVATIYWYVGGGNPFVTWLTDIADESGRTVAQIGIDMNILTFHNSCYQIPLKSIQYHGALSSR